jgi:2-methylcitrate dehydratase
MDATTARLAQYASSLDISRLPAIAVHETKRRIIDSIACAVGAYDEEFSGSIRGFAGRYSGQATARIWGTGQRSSVEMAGFANATMVRYLDLSDTYLSASAGHPSDMIAGLMALAEAEAASGTTLIAGIVAAYELYCGLCDATALSSKGLDQSNGAAIGAAGGASRILGLSAAQTENAISLALDGSVSLFNVRSGALSDWKACAGPNSARNGIFAALLARDGVTGPTAIFEGKGGLFEITGPLDIRVGVGQTPLIVNTHLKFHPVCYHGQSAVDAAVSLSGRVGIDRIAGITVETYDASVKVMGADPSRWAPTTRETADHSLPFTIAVALSGGKLTSADYLPARLVDAGLKAIMDKVQVVRSDTYTAAYPQQAASKVTIRTTDGRALSAEQVEPKGHVMNPLSDSELDAKLLNLLPPRLGEEQARRVLGLAWGIDAADSVVPLIDALAFDAAP